MPSLYARIGQLVIHSIRDKLRDFPLVEVPHIGACSLDVQQEPYIHDGNWSLIVDVRLPSSRSYISLGVFTVGSGLSDDAKALALPIPDFEDALEKRFPPEHQSAWLALHGAVEDLLISRGLSRYGTEPDYFLVDDYFPSTAVSGTLFKPGLITEDLATCFQRLLVQHAGWDFALSFDLDFKDAKYKGKEERILIREDRIVCDLNFSRLTSEFPEKFKWRESKTAL